MREPLDKITVGNYNNNENTITVEIYEEFVSASVSLTIDESFDAMQIGGVAAERQALARLLGRIFNEQKDNMVVFSSAVDFGMWKDSITYEVPDLANGGFSKTAIFTLDQSAYEKSLENTIKYIKERHSHFLNPRAKQETVAKRILGKYFK